MKVFQLLVFCVFIISCGGNVNTGAVANLDGFNAEIVPGTNITKATKMNNTGDIIEEGYISNGKRNGMWITYFEGEHKGKIKTTASYSDGILNGPFLQYSNRGQIESELHYANNKYNGKYITYKFGRMLKEVNYKNNDLHGPTREYDNKGNIQKEINYKDGKQHGIMRYYNEQGEVTVEYEYKNGEKVSGGMVEK